MRFPYKRQARRYLSYIPWLYLKVAKTFGPDVRDGRAQVVGPNSKFVIEGFQGSANTFALAAFSIAQETEFKIAHHTHSSAQLRVAKRLKIPVLVIIREPKDAILSFYGRALQLKLSDVMEDYVNYHESVLQLHSSLVIATFDEVTKDFGSVIERVNVRFGTDFKRPRNDPDSKQLALTWIDEWYQRGGWVQRRKERGIPVPDAKPKPSAKREALRSKIEEEYMSEDLRPIRERTKAIYRQLLEVKDLY